MGLLDPLKAARAIGGAVAQASGPLARVTVPATVTAELPAGPAALYWDEPKRGSSAWTESVRISGGTGKAKLARRRIGSVTIPAAGSYEIEASGTLAPEFERAELLLDPA